MPPSGQVNGAGFAENAAQTVPLRVSLDDSDAGQAGDTSSNHPPVNVCQFLKKHKWLIILLVVVVVVAVLSSAFFICRGSIHCGQMLPGWVWYNNSGYYYSDEMLDWSSSKKFCENEGVMLAVLKDDAIIENLKRFKADGDDRWYGYYKMDGKWQCLDESSLKDERLNNLSGENCKTWNPSEEEWVQDCSFKKKFVCVGPIRSLPGHCPV